MESVSFHLEVFDGPLDLLLHLIAKNKVSIYDIPISDIFAQYMEYLAQAEENCVDLTADFAAMAAQLLYIKSKMLLPVHSEEPEEDPRARLVEMLLEYQQIKAVIGNFEKRFETGKNLFTKQPEPLEPQTEYAYQHQVDELTRALRRMRERSGQKMPPPVSAFQGIVGRERASVSRQIGKIISRLSGEKSVTFWTLLGDADDRSDLVACFLAVLELMKCRKIDIEAEENGDYRILLNAGDGMEADEKPLLWYESERKGPEWNDGV